MATMTPTVHNPTNFDPSHYTVEDYLDNRRPGYCGGSVDEWANEIKMWEADMARALGTKWKHKSHRCIHCGNTNVRWITAVLHHPTNDVVVFGSDCTDRLGFANKHAFKLAQLQARADARKVAFTIYNKRAAFLAATPLLADALAHAADPVHAKNSFVADVLAKLDRYGDLSVNQVTAVLASMARDTAYAARQAVEAAEPKGDAPTGRVVVTGLVLTVKEQEGAYGFTTKMLLKLANNSKVWLTAPSKETIERGDTVTVKATFDVSKDDKSFGFGKRPTLISRTAAVTV